MACLLVRFALLAGAALLSPCVAGPSVLESGGGAARLRGGRGEQDAWHGDGFVAADGIRAMARSQGGVSTVRPQQRMFTGVREVERAVDRSPSGQFAAMAQQSQETTRPVKYIYIVSDSTGFTASHALTSCMTQFQDVIVDNDVGGDGHEDASEDLHRKEVRTQMFSNVNTWSRLDRIIQLAAKMDAFVVYTLVNPHLNARMVDKCSTLGLQYEDLLGPLVITLADYLKLKPSGLPRSSMQERRKPLSDKYFQRIEAVEFTIKHDDGNLPENCLYADAVLLGVSRTGKTPLSTYLAQQFAYKMANVPIVKGINISKAIFDVDPRKVFGLTMSPAYLKRIRSRRLAATGVDTSTIGVKEGSADYDSIQFISSEINWGKALYAANPQWVVLDVTGRSVEENSAIITELQRPGKLTAVEEALQRARSNFFLVAVTEGAASGAHAGLPPILLSDTLQAASGSSRAHLQDLSPTDPSLAAKLLSCTGAAAGDLGMVALQSALKIGQGGVWQVRARLDPGSFAEDTLCVARAAPLLDDAGLARYVVCTVATGDLQAHAAPRSAALEADHEQEGEAKTSEFVEDGDAFLRDVVAKKTHLFASDADVAARISEFVIEAKGPDFSFQFVSQAFAASLGFEPRDIVGHPLSQLWGVKTDKHCLRQVGVALGNNESFTTALLMYDKTRTASWRHVYFEPLYRAQDNEAVLFLGVQLM